MRKVLAESSTSTRTTHSSKRRRNCFLLVQQLVIATLVAFVGISIAITISSLLSSKTERIDLEDLFETNASLGASIGTDEEELSKNIDSGTASSHTASIATGTISPGPTTTTTTDKQHLAFLLTVPFYVYEEFLHDENLLNITDMVLLGDNPNQTTYDNFNDLLESRKFHKHSGDLHFIRSALEHPMRVKQPEHAKLFVVPSLIYIDIAELIYFVGDPQIKARRLSNIKRIDEFLAHSPWFKRNDGADHIAPISHQIYSLIKPLRIPKIAPHLAKCNMVQEHESNSDPTCIHPDYADKRAMYKIFYTASPCNITAVEKKRKDYAFSGALHRFKHGQNKQFQSRRDICSWLPSHTNYTFDVCGYGDKCPHLSQALLGFHALGDSMSASRLFDTIMSGTVPIFTLKRHYQAQPEWYDWSQISYFADVQNKTQFLADIEKIMSNKTDIMLKTQNILANMDLFNWQTNVPFDIYMVSSKFECVSLFHLVVYSIEQTHSSDLHLFQKIILIVSSASKALSRNSSQQKIKVQCIDSSLRTP